MRNLLLTLGVVALASVSVWSFGGGQRDTSSSAQAASTDTAMPSIQDIMGKAGPLPTHNWSEPF